MASEFDGLNLTIEDLRDPRISLINYGTVLEQAGRGGDIDKIVPFDPYAITHYMQSTIVSYMGAPPRNELGETLWFVCLKSRQTGGSTTVESAAYPLAAYTPGFDHVCFADTRDRAEYLHDRVHIVHDNWPPELRVRTPSSREVNQLTFDATFGGKMRIMSVGQAAAGIGQAPSSFHWSEVPFAEGAARQWTLLFPSMSNKRNARVVFESTPAEADQPSVEFWKSLCYDAKKREGRWIYGFYPMMDGKLNRRPWRKDWKPDLEELRLLEEYGTVSRERPIPLTLEHLAFRRYTMTMDPEIRRNPELFGVYYPFDDLKCWASAMKGVLRPGILDKQLKRILVPWREPFMEYKAPRAGAQYVIGSDPAGWGVRDHAAIQVLEVWDDQWEQVACFAANTIDPPSYGKELVRLGEKYNNALIVVESNGVGAGALTALQLLGYRRVFGEASGKPGFASTGKSVQQGLDWLSSALEDMLLLNDKDTVEQLGSYKNDKLVENSPRAEMFQGDKRTSGNRRPRHHWDKVSALIMAIVGARSMPMRRRPERPIEIPEAPPAFAEMSYDRQRKYLEQVARDNTPASNRTVYRKIRRRGGRR